MYNVEEAYMATIKSGSEQFKKLLTYTEKQIQSAIKKGVFATDLDLGHNIYPVHDVHDIDRLQEFLLFLGYKVERTEYTNDITRLYIQWTEAEFKKYLDNQ